MSLWANGLVFLFQHHGARYRTIDSRWLCWSHSDAWFNPQLSFKKSLASRSASTVSFLLQDKCCGLLFKNEWFLWAILHTKTVNTIHNIAKTHYANVLWFFIYNSYQDGFDFPESGGTICGALVIAKLMSIGVQVMALWHYGRYIYT